MNREPYTLRIPKEMKVKLSEMAKQMGTSVNSIILNAVWKFIKSEEAAA